MSITEAEVARFWAKVNKTETCWLWTAGLSTSGYGSGGPKSTTKVAHRVAYEMLVGPIPPGLQLDHLCRVRHCVNPAHLEPVTPRENVLRSTNANAVNARKTHCKHGHEFTVENTYIKRKTESGFPRRMCKACTRIRMARLAASRRAAA